MRFLKLCFVLMVVGSVCSHSKQKISTSDLKTGKADTTKVDTSIGESGAAIIDSARKNIEGVIYRSDDAQIIGDTTIDKKKIFYTSQKFEPYISFDDFKVAIVHHGTNAQINYNSNPTARRFKTVITASYAKSDVNFAGKYVLVSWGCGSPCEQSAIVDVINGNVYDGPQASLYYDFRDYSRLLIVNPPHDSTGLFDDCAWCHPEIWIWNENEKKFFEKKASKN